VLPYEFLEFFSGFFEKCHKNFNGDCIEGFVDPFGNTVI
jgi:hypothetical protein